MNTLRLAAVDGVPVGTPRESKGGFVAIPNDIFDGAYKARLTPTQRDILFAICRKTFGYNKASDDVTITQLAEYLGVSRQNASPAFNALVERDIVSARKGKYGFIVSVNRPSMWADGSTENKRIYKAKNGSKTPSEIQTFVMVQDMRPSEIQTHNIQPQQTVVEEDKSSSPTVSKSRKLRQVNTDACGVQFEAFWAEYPRKQKKKEAAKAFAKLGITSQQLKSILDDLKNRKQSADWMKDGGQFIPLPTSYLNAERWNDEPVVVIEAWTQEQQQFVNAFNERLGAELGEVTEWTAGRAEAIGRALASKTWDLQRYVKFFAWLADSSDFGRMPRNANFDWLMRAETFANCIEGRYSKESGK